MFHLLLRTIEVIGIVAALATGTAAVLATISYNDIKQKLLPHKISQSDIIKIEAELRKNKPILIGSVFSRNNPGVASYTEIFEGELDEDLKRRFGSKDWIEITS